MGFTTVQYRKGYILAEHPYVCLGSYCEVQRSINENTKYKATCVFNIHYSLEERNRNPTGSVIDNRIYTLNLNDLPNNLIQQFYNIVKTDFTVTQDNL